jgi:ABC-type Fe3+-hydroxamate transport system substrate-binding protein
MITDFAAMLATLGEAQQIASLAMDATAGDSGSDSRTLTDPHAYVRDFAHQADAVLVQLRESGEHAGLIGVAEALVEFFQAAEAQLRARLAIRLG